MTNNSMPVIRNGFMKFIRLGPVEFNKQKLWKDRAPERSGIWCFPYPYYDVFFTHHKYRFLLPKKLQNHEKKTVFPKSLEWYINNGNRKLETTDDCFVYDQEYDDFVLADDIDVNESFYDEQDKWIDTIGRKIMPIKTFWYQGDVYSHFMPDGSTGNTNPLAGSLEWSLVDIQKLNKLIKKSGARYFDGHDANGIKTRQYSVDHLEIFIPRNRGIIRSIKGF